MKHTEKEIEELITDYLAHETTQEMNHKLSELLEEEACSRLFRRRTQSWWLFRTLLRWQQVDAGAAWKQVKRRTGYQRVYQWKRAVGYAALLALMAGSGFYVLTRTMPVEPTYSGNNHTSGATLTLSNGEKILLPQKREGIIRQDTTFNIELTVEKGLVCTALSTTLRDTVPHYQTLAVPQGCDFLLTLSDGSRVWLNAESVLKYPEKFVAGKREVELQGEGYFEIQADSSAPFEIRTQGLKTIVLGTAFNLKAYPNEAEVITTLVSGHIRQECEGIRPVVLTPNTQSVYKPGENQIQTWQVNPAEALAWKNGRFIFKNRPLQEIFRELTRWYQLEEVEYFPPEVKNTCFYLNTERYGNIRTVLDKLEKTNTLNFEIQGKKISVHKNKSNPKIKS